MCIMCIMLIISDLYDQAKSIVGFLVCKTANPDQHACKLIIPDPSSLNMIKPNLLCACQPFWVESAGPDQCACLGDRLIKSIQLIILDHFQPAHDQAKSIVGFLACMSIILGQECLS
jgi:hypothetical protein